MRVVVLSDTHNGHRDLEVPKGDVLIHCGDLTKRGSAPELREVNSWLEESSGRLRRTGTEVYSCTDSIYVHRYIHEDT